MSGLSDERLAELAAAAEAATPGEWAVWNVLYDGRAEVFVPNGTMSTETILEFKDFTDCEECHRPSPEDAAHIAAFDPPTALALVAEVQRLRAVVGALVSALQRTESNFVSAVHNLPVRDMTETLAENEAAIRAALDGSR